MLSNKLTILKEFDGTFNLVDIDRQKICCLEVLEELIVVPKAKFYWIEIQKKQWADQSGVEMDIQISKMFDMQLSLAYWRFPESKKWQCFWVKASESIETKMYFRL